MILFDSCESGRRAVVVVFDLEGSSEFSTIPNAAHYTAEYLNIVFGAIEEIYKPSRPSWLLAEYEWRCVRRRPDFEKFTGDGAIYIWFPTESEEGVKAFDDEFLVTVLNAFRVLRLQFSQITQRAKTQIPLSQLPKQIRVGISIGDVHSLSAGDDSNADYFGYAINLASRLQSYCKSVSPKLGLLASAELIRGDESLLKYRYVQAIAKKLPFSDVPRVLIHSDDYNELYTSAQSNFFGDVSPLELIKPYNLKRREEVDVFREKAIKKLKKVLNVRVRERYEITADSTRIYYLETEHTIYVVSTVPTRSRKRVVQQAEALVEHIEAEYKKLSGGGKKVEPVVVMRYENGNPRGDGRTLTGVPVNGRIYTRVCTPRYNENEDDIPNFGAAFVR